MRERWGKAKRKRLSLFTDGVIIKKWFPTIFVWKLKSGCKGKPGEQCLLHVNPKAPHPYPIPGLCCTQCGLGLLRFLIQAMSSMSKVLPPLSLTISI